MQPIDNRLVRTTVLIVVAVRLYREGLVAALRAHPQLAIHETSGAAGEVLARARALQPDVVVVDVSRPGFCELVRSLRADDSSARVLAFAVDQQIDAILEFATAGADAFFDSNGSLAELVEAIERTANGELLCSPRVAAQLFRQAAQQAGRELPPGALAAHADARLTRRERQVLDLLKQGRSNKEIASQLRIAEATVKNHVHNVLEKMQVSTRGKAAAVSGLQLAG